MKKVMEKYNTNEKRIIKWMGSHGILLLRLSMGIIFFWFGVLKFFPGLSPAEDIAIKTIRTITFGFIPDALIIYGLALWETVIGLGLIFNIFPRITLVLLFLQMLGTFTPLFLFPGELFYVFPFSLTIEGQYIVKNIIIISAGLVLGAKIKGRKFMPE